MEILSIVVIVIFIWNISLEFRIGKLKNEQTMSSLSMEDLKTLINKRNKRKKHN